MLLATTPVGDPAVAAPVEDPTPWPQAVLDLPNGGIAFDKAHDVLLVAVAQDVPVLGNHLVEMDPQTGELGRSVYVGSRPYQLAVSGNGTRAYVALEGAPVITEVDLEAFVVLRTIPVGFDPSYGSLYAQDIAVQPGNPEVIAVSYWCCSSDLGVAIFDHGVRRPVVPAVPLRASRLAFAGPGVLYGIDAHSSSGWLFSLAVDATGVHETSRATLIDSTGPAPDIHFAGGLLHVGNGQVIDPVAQTVVGSYERRGSMAVDMANGQTFVLGYDGLLTRHSTTTLLQNAEVSTGFLAPHAFRPGTGLSDTGVGLAARNEEAVLLIGPGVTGTSFALPSPPASALDVGAVHTIPLDAQALVGAPDGSVLYAALGSDDSTHPYEVVEVDPFSGVVGRNVFVGANPQFLEVSSDGSTLMVGHATATKVTEIDVETFTVKRTVSLHPTGSSGAYYAGGIAAVPGDPGRYAVILNDPSSGPPLMGVALVDDGVILPHITPGHTGPTAVAFAGSASTLFGTDGDQGSFYAMDVTDDGLEVVRGDHRLAIGVHGPLASADGLIYGAGGGVIDPFAPRQTGLFGSWGLPVPQPDHDRLFTVAGTDVLEYDLHERWPVAVHAAVTSYGVAAVSVGDVLAVAGDDGTLTLLPLLGAEPPCVSGFVDVSGHHPFCEEIDWLASEGIAGGYEDGTYRPTSPVSRQAMAAFLYRSAGSPAYTPPAAPTFEDVPLAHPFFAEIEWLSAEAIAEGFGDGTFRPTSSVSRQAMAAFLYRASDSPAFVPPPEPTFDDVSTAHSFFAEIEWLAAEEIAGGFLDGTYRPGADVTRQAMAAFLHDWKVGA